MSGFRIAYKIVGVVVLCFFNGACGTSYLSDRRDNPVIQDSTTASYIPWNKTKIDVFATTASRRLVIIKDDRETGGKLTSCAEPPPDVGEAFSAAIAAGLEGALSLSQGTDTKVGATIAGNFGREVATQIAPLLYRTQGLQLYRDTQWGLCNDLMSRYIDEGTYLQKKEDRFTKTLELIRFEIPLMLEAQKFYFAAVKAGGEKVDLDTVKKMIEAVTPKKEVKQPPSSE